MVFSTNVGERADKGWPDNGIFEYSPGLGPYNAVDSIYRDLIVNGLSIAMFNEQNTHMDTECGTIIL